MMHMEADLYALSIVQGGTKGVQSAVIGCTKAARSQGRTDRCIKHGGGKRCEHDGCGKGAQGKTD
jgi:hypothetical protein